MRKKSIFKGGSQLHVVKGTLFSWLLLGAMLTVQAQPPRYFPYKGVLEIDGAQIDSPSVNMMFFIASRPDIAVDSENGAGSLWHEFHRDENGVAVTAGKFDVVLGTRAALGVDLFSNQAALYLGVKVENNGVWIDLNPRQRLLPLPYALHAKEAEHAVDADNAVTSVNAEQAQDFTVNGTLTAPNLQGQQVVVTGDEADGADDENVPLKIVSGNERMVIDGNEIESNGTLYLQRHGLGKTHFAGALEVDGEIKIKDGKEIHGFSYSESELLFVQNDSGVQEDDLGHKNGRVCFLSSVSMFDLNELHESAECKVTINDQDHWVLEVQSLRFDDDDGELEEVPENRDGGGARCQARCLIWNPQIQ